MEINELSYFDIENINRYEKQERINFVNKVKETILNTFIFSPKYENERKMAFVNKLDSILENIDNFLDRTILVRQVRIAIALLEDGHTELIQNTNERKYVLKHSIYYKAEKFWVDVDDKTFEVVCLNNIPIGKLIEERMKEIGGGTKQHRIYIALILIKNSEKEENVVLKTIDAQGKTIEIKTSFSERESKSKKFVECKILSEKIGYLKVTSWGKDIKVDGKNIAELVEDELSKLKNCDSIIFDVRGNGGGASNLAEKIAAYFIDKDTQYCRTLIKNGKQNELIEKKYILHPNGEYLNKKVVILTNLKCFSATEMFILMLKDTGRAITVGQTTGGGSGNPVKVDLSLGENKFVLRVSSKWIMLRNNGQEIEGKGIEPDIPVKITPKDVINHRDVELEKAVEYLENK